LFFKVEAEEEVKALEAKLEKCRGDLHQRSKSTTTELEAAELQKQITQSVAPFVTLPSPCM